MTLISTFSRALAGTGIATLSLVAFAGLAAAGECPKGKMKEGAVTTGEMSPKGVTDTVIASIDLSPKGPEFKGLMMRMRKLVVAPGGIVPWHDHKTRPANIYVVSGTIEEYRSTCEVPIMHKAGDVTAEFGASLAHWWKNTSKKQTVLISADIVPADTTADKMM
jgi:quercetin dioxygenase-like cupin family protein